mgnify:CR=1 FL=1
MYNSMEAEKTLKGLNIMAGLSDLFDTQSLCGSFNSVCQQVVRGSEMTAEPRDAARDIDRGVSDARRGVDAVQNGDIQRAVDAGQRVLGNILGR